jgi:hypothetical protein
MVILKPCIMSLTSRTIHRLLIILFVFQAFIRELFERVCELKGVEQEKVLIFSFYHLVSDFFFFDLI